MGGLPFLTTAQLLNGKGDQIVQRMSISVWPTSGSVSDAAGETFDHTGEAPLGYAAQLDGTNLQIETADGRRYRIISAEPQPLVPHVALRLRRVRAGG
jgi:hypothetical protein